MKSKLFILFILLPSLLFITLQSCSKEETLTSDPFVVAFDNLSKNVTEITEEENIAIIYSEPALENGYVTIHINPKNIVYSKDFTTIPAAVNNQITIPIIKGETKSSILFKKLNSFLDETCAIQFDIANIHYSNASIQGNTSFLINSSPSLGGSIKPNIGGPNEENQVYIDLSNQKTTLSKRDAWDLGFYSGNNSRVIINGSIYMAAKSIGITNIDAITKSDVTSLQKEVAVGTFNANNISYIDAPNGSIEETAISEISINAKENEVYLLNLGYEVSIEKPITGSVAVAGKHRGWKKIRILKKDENNYILQYADLNDTNHQEVILPKDSNHNFTFFSFNTNSVINIEPQKQKWDLNFTVATSIIPEIGTYGFSDYIVHNRKGGVKVYRVSTSDFSYEDFTVSNIHKNNFSENQNVIGSNWRNVHTRIVATDHFYVLQDFNGILYKLRLLTLTNNKGERGCPEFEYKQLK